MKPRKHAELIRAWADGAEIQVWSERGIVPFWKNVENPLFYDCQIYRIRPNEKVVRWLWAFRKDDEIRGEHGWLYTNSFVSDEEMEAQKKLRPDVKYIKLEWSREEFDE